MSIKRTLLTLTTVVVTALFTGIANAGAPDMKTPAPVIYLADNLDEKDKLGWCIDTKGRGFSEELHAHSCKPRGGDVQFSYNVDTLQIVSPTFENKCAELKEAAQEGTMLGLLDCKEDMPEQRFVYDTEGQVFHPESDEALCLAAGDSSKSAGPFMSRDLVLASCEATDPTLKQWIIVEAEAES